MDNCSVNIYWGDVLLKMSYNVLFKENVVMKIVGHVCKNQVTLNTNNKGVYSMLYESH